MTVMDLLHGVCVLVWIVVCLIMMNTHENVASGRELERLVVVVVVAWFQSGKDTASLYSVCTMFQLPVRERRALFVLDDEE